MSDNEQLDSSSSERGSSSDRGTFLVVGIGGSAGGITALRDFFQHVSTDSGMAFVVIMHLSPQHESSLAELLQVHTKIPVMQVKETVHVQPNHVYVIPPTKYLVIQDGEIRLAQPERVRAAHTSIDVFFRTLADAYGTEAIGIILSGTGTDGTLGLRRIKEKGGFAIVQDPAEAEYDSMPRNAIDTGLVDLILPVAQMADRIQSLHAGGHELHEAAAVEEQREEPQSDMNIQEVLNLLRQRTGHDFTQYKRPTLLRRIARRLQVNRTASVEEYTEYLREHSEETPLLLRDLLITVTNFFRDREAYDVLAKEVVPRLFAGKGNADQVRVWVVGCASGEEAYSLAMLLCEHAATLAEPPKIQIFATDIDERSIAEARDGSYPHSISLDVSPQRLRQFFSKEGDRYRVKKELRELILFAPYNVLRDPPFSKLDLVSCRNLLIYLSREMQQRALGTFHFALVPGGYLFLGASESAEGSPMLFLAIGKKQRIFIRRAAVVAGKITRDIPRLGDWNFKPVDMPGGGAKPQVAGALHQKVVEQLAPPSVLINEDYEVLHSSEHAGRFLRFSGGEPSRNLLKVVLPSIRLDLQALLLAASARSNETNSVSESRRLDAEIDGKPALINLTVRRVSEDPPGAHGFFLVLFEETLRRTDDRARSEDGDPHLEVVKQLEEELQRTRDQLHLTVDQYETTTEELKASNEELQAINEELRSTTEELETSKEELQSVNEELNTVNTELRDKIDEVGRANSDLLNLMSSTDIGTIFLDRGLCIKRYTESVRELFNITHADIGRPLEHFTHKLQYAGMAEDAEGVLRTLQTRERDVRGENGRWYLLRIVPYRTLDNRIDGVVLNFVDITEHRHAEELMQQAAALQEQSQILGLANVFIRGLDDRIVLWNTGCERLYGYTKEEAAGAISYELLRTEFSRPLAELKTQLFTAGSWDGELVQLTRRGERVSVASRWVLYRNDNGEPTAILEVDHDVTARKRAEEELRQSDLHKDQFLAALAHELRNPLAVIQGGMELLVGAGDAKSSEQAYQPMARQVTQLMRLVDDLLDFERLARGKIMLKKEVVSARSVVDDALENSHSLLAVRGQQLDTSSLGGADAYVLADRMRLAQVIFNLLNNASKFTPVGGKIELGSAIEDRNVVLWVRDNGQGIPPEVLPHIFDYFVQEDPSSEAHRRGLGVGLALAYQLVELHGGTIQAKSAGKDKGSEFVVRIPLAAEQPAPQKSTSSPGAIPEPAPVPGKILVVDDEHDVADLTAILLEREGHQVRTAYSGKAALELAGEDQPDVALVDIAMPEMDGYEVARRLRRHHPGILLIAVTGLVQQSDRARAKEAGFDYHLAKPASIGQIEELISSRASPADGKMQS